MSISARLKNFFESHRIAYEVIYHPRTTTLLDVAKRLNIPPAQVVRTVVLTDHKSALLAVLPLDQKLDFAKLCRLTRRTLTILPKDRADKLFYDCEPGAHPPFGEPYHIRTIGDSQLLKYEAIYLEGGSHHTLVRISREDLHFLSSPKYLIWGSIAVPRTTQSPSTYWDPPEAAALEKRFNVNELSPLYPIPELPQRLKDLIHDNQNNPVPWYDFAAWIKDDPFLQSLYTFIHGTTTPTTSRLTAFSQTLFGVETHQTGPIGFENFWVHALLSALLARRIVEHYQLAIVPEIAYLAGLFHNMGYLLMAHLFPPEFNMLNKLITNHPAEPVERLEKRIVGMGSAQHVLGCGHGEMGAWLLQRWSLPKVLQTVATYHHKALYTGPDEEAVRLIHLVDTLLRQRGLGEGSPYAPDSVTLSGRDIPFEELQKLCDEVFQNKDQLVKSVMAKAANS